MEPVGVFVICMDRKDEDDNRDNKPSTIGNFDGPVN